MLQKWTLLNSVRAELYKLVRHPLLWLLTIGAALLVGLGVLAVSTDPIQPTVAQGFSRMLDFEGLLMQLAVGAVMLVTAAWSTSIEFSQGTVRVLAGRGQTMLTQYASKVLSLIIVGLVISIVAGVLLTAVSYRMLASQFGSVALAALPGWCWKNFEIASGIQLVSLFTVILLGSFAGVVLRSGVLGMIIALGWFPLENLVVLFTQLLMVKSSNLQVLRVTSYLLGPNLNHLHNVWESHRAPVIIFSEPDSLFSGPWQAALVIAAYDVLLLAFGLGLLVLRDVKE